MTGKLRMQWWRERIYHVFDAPEADRATQDTLLLRALARAVHEHDLTRRWFERLIDARVSRAMLRFWCRVLFTEGVLSLGTRS